MSYRKDLKAYRRPLKRDMRVLRGAIPIPHAEWEARNTLAAYYERLVLRLPFESVLALKGEIEALGKQVAVA